MCFVETVLVNGSHTFIPSYRRRVTGAVKRDEEDLVKQELRDRGTAVLECQERDTSDFSCLPVIISQQWDT
jgi:hypothetical protein